MNKVKAILVVISIATLVGCASKGDLEKTNIQIKTLEERITAFENRASQLEQRQVDQTRLDFSRFCFSNNMAFSEGSIYASKICERRSGTTVFEAGRVVPQPLVWSPWKYQ